ncbi:MAG TPA: chemotaxis protein CheW, partial [Pseudomonadales bacterium]
AAHAIAHRNRTLPLLELGQLLQVGTEAPQAGEALVVVVTFGGQWGGIRVDRLGERMEVMLKPLEGLLSGMPGITGTTIMGDGRVLLVLDLAEVLS